MEDVIAMAANTKIKKTNAVKEDPSPYSPTQIKKFVQEVQAEFSKIVWPDKKTTLGLTGIVAVLTVVLSLYLGSVDLLLGKFIGMFLR
jgi:preprotein translocase subunit SecE